MAFIDRKNRVILYCFSVFAVAVGVAGCYFGNRDAAAFSRLHLHANYDSPIPGFAFLLGWAGVFVLGSSLLVEPSKISKIFGAVFLLIAATPAIYFAYTVITTR